MSDDMLKEFANPGSDYRGAPFWAWNGKLEPEELRRQIRLMKEMGLGGFFMHARVGLDTEYLGKDWFDCVRACVDEAKKLEMKAWLYDEDRWPSGAAGGLVTKNPAHRQKHLKMTVQDNAATGADTLALFSVKLSGNTVSDVKRLDLKNPGGLAPGHQCLRFDLGVAEPSSWFNNQTYLDTMSHEAVGEFIRVTHESYLREVGEAFGDVVPGIFTDEPDYGGFSLDADKPCHLPWTPALPDTFRSRHGYELLDHLPEIFLDLEGADNLRARHDYVDSITFLFTESFGRQIGEWCGEHGFAFTGHLMEEDTLRRQTSRVGSCMRFYEHQQTPGMDQLCERSRIYDTAKMVSSAAHQFGRKWRLTETYGCTGWDFPFAGHKAIGDWQAALGINVRCQHLAWYTMAGEAKRDYPASVFYQSPWWDSYRKVEDYFARIFSVMTRGEDVRDLLMIIPVESMWLLAKRGWQDDPRVKQLEDDFANTREALLNAHLDFDFGDEELMSRLASVEGKALRVGKAAYKAVVVPPCLTLRSSTLELLKRFQTSGGQVLFVGEPPAMLDATKSGAVKDFAAKVGSVPLSAAAIAKALEGACRKVSIADADGREIAPSLYLLKEDAEGYYLFLCNSSEPADFDHLGTPLWVDQKTAAFDRVTVDFKVKTAGKPLELDLEGGLILDAVAESCPDGWRIKTSLPVLGSRLFVFPKQLGKTSYPARPALQAVKSLPLAPEGWDYSLSDANVLALDRPSYRLGDGPWRDAEEVLRVDRVVRAAVGVPLRGGAMAQPWVEKGTWKGKNLDVSLRYVFEVSEPPRTPLALALERPEFFQVKVNGKALSADMQSGWWRDVSLRTLAVSPALLWQGRNEIELSLNYREGFPGLEIVYLLGAFGVELKGGLDATLTSLPALLDFGDVTVQGLPFYAGNIAYRQTVSAKLAAGERLFLELDDISGVAVKVAVDGQEVGVLAWRPFELDLTAAVAGKGSFELQVEVLGHCRNSHGPLHLAKRVDWNGPGQFLSEGDDWSEAYKLVKLGLPSAPRLTLRKVQE